jgi:N-formylmaleamate deformylase
MSLKQNPPSRGRHVTVNGVRLHYVQIGQGRPPLVLLPGITSPAATWEFVAQRLAAACDVFVLDHRGRGLSQGGEDLGYTLDNYAADTQALIERLGLDRPDILGHSMGARIAVRLAARYPKNVGRLLLVDPPVSGPGRRPYPIPLDFYLESLAQVSRGEGLEEMKQRFNWTEQQIETRMQWLPSCDPAAIKGSHASFQEEDMHADLPSITARTLLIYAEHGDTVRDEDAQEIVQGLGGQADKVRIAGAGHMIPWDRLDDFVETVTAFLQ